MAATTLVTLSTAPETGRAVDDLLEQLSRGSGGLKVRGAILYHSVAHDPAAVQAALRSKLPGVPLLGTTSCLGVGTGAGYSTGTVLSGFFLLGEGFRFGTAVGRKNGDARALGEKVARAALANAGISGAQARFALVHPTPGQEEEILDGAFSLLDRQAAVIGGSAADNDLSGKWSVWTQETVCGAGFAMAVCDWPWKIGTNYQAGYLPTAKRGKVTAASGRTLLTIDGRPAAEVYNEWSEGHIAAELKSGGNVLAKTTMSPIGIPRGMFGGFEAYVLVHPESVDPATGGLRLFANVEVGQSVVLMSSSVDALVHRGAMVARAALSRSAMTASEVAGALVVYCAGCVLAIQQQMPQTIDEIQRTLPGVPFSSVFSFGEQGCVLPKQVAHGNLMASVLLLGKG